MQFKYFASSAALVAAASAQSLQEVLSKHNSSLSTFQSILQNQPNFNQSLSSAQNVTLLAPNNAAFSRVFGNSSDSLTTAVLQYHVVRGTYNVSDISGNTNFLRTMLTNETYTNVTGGQRVQAIKDDNGSVTFSSGLGQNTTVQTADIAFDGGTIHIVNSILAIPTTPSLTAQFAGLTSFVGALGLTNSTNTLNQEVESTYFIPTNQAFQNVGTGLRNITTQQLNEIVGYHVLTGRVEYSNLLANSSVPTLEGSDINIGEVNGSLYVNSAKIIYPNILTSNGVIHVIDGVLNPNNTNATPASNSTASAAFPGVSALADAPFTSGVPAASTTLTGTGVAVAESTSAAASGIGGPTSVQSAGGAARTGAMGFGALFGGAALFAAGL